jgi:hypothetical protein
MGAMGAHFSYSSLPCEPLECRRKHRTPLARGILDARGDAAVTLPFEAIPEAAHLTALAATLAAIVFLRTREDYGPPRRGSDARLV